MGNVISTHIALFPKLDSTLEHQSISEITTGMLKSYFGNTYHSSPFIISQQANWMYDISYCAKWEPAGVFELFAENSKLYDKAFVRFLDDMGDYDRIFSLPVTDKSDAISNATDCKYLFDQILFSAFEGHEKLIPQSQPMYEGLLKINLNGTLFSRSEIPFDLNNGINSYILETPDRISTFPSSEIICQNPEVLLLILNNSGDVSFLYNECTIERRLAVANIHGPITDKVRNNIYWANNNQESVKYHSCGWLNCGHEEYLDYIRQRKTNYTEYSERLRMERGY